MKMTSEMLNGKWGKIVKEVKSRSCQKCGAVSASLLQVIGRARKESISSHREDEISDRKEIHMS